MQPPASAAGAPDAPDRPPFQCAWCKAPFGASRMTGGAVSHGICRPCLSRLVREAGIPAGPGAD